MDFSLICFQALFTPNIATQRLRKIITGTPRVRSFWSSRTKKKSSQCSNASTGYGPNCLTHVSLKFSLKHGLCLHPIDSNFNWSWRIIKELNNHFIGQEKTASVSTGTIRKFRTQQNLYTLFHNLFLADHSIFDLNFEFDPLFSLNLEIS